MENRFRRLPPVIRAGIVRTISSKKGVLATLILSSLVLAPGCSGAKPTLKFAEDALFEPIALGEWGESGNLRFRITKVEEVESLEEASGQIRASRANRLVVISLEVMTARKGEGEVDLVFSLALVDGQGRGYELDGGLYSMLNGSAPKIAIPTGQFVVRRVVFEVSKAFEPAALRCLGGEGAEPVYLRLLRAE